MTRHFIIFILLVSNTVFPASISKPVMEQGAIFAVRIPVNEAVKDVSVKWNDMSTKAVRDPNLENTLTAFFGVPHDASVSKETVTLTYHTEKSDTLETLSFDVKAAKFGSERLKVDPAKVKLSPKDQERTKLETEEVRAIYSSPHPTPLWKGKFEKPSKSDLRSVFGTNRIFNGDTKGHHSGVDYRAAIGSKIRASGNGIVRLAKDLFYAGNIILLDHGAGIFTIYAHLSRTDVNVGDSIKLGQVLGLSGATGRVNGPHLHWGVRIHGVEANPLELLALY